MKSFQEVLLRMIEKSFVLISLSLLLLSGCSPSIRPLVAPDNISLKEIEERTSYTGLTINYDKGEITSNNSGRLENVMIGKIDNYDVFLKVLRKKFKIIANDNNFIVINYYPGKNICSESGTKDKVRIRNIHGTIWSGLHTIAKTKPLYIYHDYKGLERYEGIIEWLPDSGTMIQDIFFKEDYPCGSFVVINSLGEFMTYNGEHPIEFIWQYAMTLKERE